MDVNARYEQGLSVRGTLSWSGMRFAHPLCCLTLCLVGADAQLSVKHPFHLSLSPVSDSPSTVLLHIQHGLSSPFELPLTQSGEQTGGWLRLQGIYFILSACTIENQSLWGEQAAPVSQCNLCSYARASKPTPPSPPRMNARKCRRHARLVAYTLKNVP